MRLNIKDVESSVYTPNQNKVEGVVDYKPTKEDVVFTIRGEHDYMYEDIPAISDSTRVKAEMRKTACAKKVGHRYYLKINSRGELFNPIDPAHLAQSDRKENGLPIWKYANVAYTTFCHYSHFLKTRNQNFLILARRDMGST